MITALIPYFGGTGHAAPSEAANRPGYLRRTIASLESFADCVIIGVCDEERALPDVSVDDIHRFSVEPQYIPSTMLRWAQKILPPTQIYVTEADQVLHYDPAVLGIVEGLTYLVPHRLEELGPLGEGSKRGNIVDWDGRRWVMPNGSPVPGRMFYNPDLFVLQYGGAYLASWELFSGATFPNRDQHPVEHATGFDIGRYGYAMKTGHWNRFFVEHLSGYEYHARSEEE